MASKTAAGSGGGVLEIAVGAGANFPYYPPGVKVTAIDISSEMLKRARQAANEFGVETEFILSAIESLEFADHSFDTVVSTLSLCCYVRGIGQTAPLVQAQGKDVVH